MTQRASRNCKRWPPRSRQNPSPSTGSCASPVRCAARCSRRTGWMRTCRSLKWTLELAQVPVAPALVELLDRRRANGPRSEARAGARRAGARQRADPLGAFARGAVAGRPARRVGRRERRFGHLVAQDAALRRVLLDRQRLRRADAVDVRRRAARARRRRSSSTRRARSRTSAISPIRPPPTRSRPRSSNRRCRPAFAPSARSPGPARIRAACAARPRRTTPQSPR